MIYLLFYKNIFRIFLLIFYSNTILFSQSINFEPLAKIGENVILKNEFQNRLNFYPREGIQDKNSNEGIKNELLYTLIAEKLWVNHALETGYDKNISVITAKNVIEKMFVRDELYKHEIKDKIIVSPEEIDSAISKYNIILDCITFYHHDKEILNTYVNSQISNNVLLDLETLNSDDEILTKRLNISFGDLNEDIEDVLYSLKSGEFTQPIKLEEGWNIFYLINKNERKYKDTKEKLNSIKNVNKILSGRKEDRRYDDFYQKFFKNVKVDIDAGLFNLISEELSGVFLQKFSSGIFYKDKNGDDLILLDTEDLRFLENKLGSEILNQTFIKFQINPIDLITFLREISFQSFSVKSPNLSEIKITLNNTIKEYIKHELLSRKGYEKGLDQMPSVRYWVKIWYENFLYQAIRKDQLENKENGIKSVFLDKNDKEYQQNAYSKNNYKKFVEKTIELSDRYDISIDREMFDSISQGNINMFVLRNLGFGGRIAGVPSSPVFIDWYLEKQKRDLQNL